MLKNFIEIMDFYNKYIFEVGKNHKRMESWGREIQGVYFIVSIILSGLNFMSCI